MAETNQEQEGLAPRPAPLLLTILGATAGGKTRLAALCAHRLDGEVLSADSRQVYCGMDIGTGKDKKDYLVEGHVVPAHLIDLVEAGTRFSVFDFQRAFVEAFAGIVSRGKLPILCGGSGLYLESVLMDYRFVQVPRDEGLRARLERMSFSQLADELATLKTLHNRTDLVDRPTLIRAIEVAVYEKDHPDEALDLPRMKHMVFGLRWPRGLLRQRIRRRLEERLDEGLVEEVQALLDQGVDPEVLDGYGLEYRFVLRHIRGELDRTELTDKLAQAIGKFAKRQETWFRRMERRGCKIEWLDGRDDQQHNMDRILAAVSAANKGDPPTPKSA